MDQVVILAGGHGSRMKAAIPKPMLEVLGVPMLGWVVQACEAADLRNICVVTGYKSQFIEHYLNNKYKTVLQAERLGTGHAVMQAVPVLEENPDGNTLVLCGDAPFMDSIPSPQSDRNFMVDRAISCCFASCVMAKNPALCRFCGLWREMRNYGYF